MLFSKQASLRALVSWCRSLRHGLQAGLDMPRLFDMQAKKGPAELRDVAVDLAAKLRAGESLPDAFQPHAERFPPLFNELIAVGEQTGHLPEIFGELEKHFALRQTMIRQFRSAITLPVFQFFAAIFVIAGLIFVLGMISEGSGSPPIKVFGLSGTGGALTFLAAAFTTLALFVMAFLFVKGNYPIRAVIESFLIKVPKVGSCLRAFAMNRFCTAFHLTMLGGMTVIKAIDLSLRASGNAFFMRAGPGIGRSIKTGYDLTESLKMANIFDSHFLEVVEVAEESGRISESMEQQSRQYAEEAEHQLKVMTQLAGFGVWALVAIFIIICIFQVANIYIGAIDGAGKGM